jgi:sortase A
MIMKHIVFFFAALVPLCIAAFTLYLFHQHSHALSSGASQQIVNPHTVSKSYPIRIKIPKIHVDAAIENIGITQGGAMDVPGSIMDGGWYKYGSVPGNIGSAVIDGHIDGKNGEAGVFALLHLLGKGDNIYIVDNKGKSIFFIVSKTRMFNLKEDTSGIFNQTDGRHLNLITCSGTWDNSQQFYTKRLVVFADILR